jgi:hypothetical protein
VVLTWAGVFRLVFRLHCYLDSFSDCCYHGSL